MGVERYSRRPVRPRLLSYLRITVYSLATLLGLSLLTVGTVAIIAKVKGTWHWMIHLETTVAYMAVFIKWQLVVIGPLLGLLLYGRVRWDG